MIHQITTAQKILYIKTFCMRLTAYNPTIILIYCIHILNKTHSPQVYTLLCMNLKIHSFIRKTKQNIDHMHIISILCCFPNHSDAYLFIVGYNGKKYFAAQSHQPWFQEPHNRSNHCWESNPKEISKDWFTIPTLCSPRHRGDPPKNSSSVVLFTHKHIYLCHTYKKH